MDLFKKPAPAKLETAPPKVTTAPTTQPGPGGPRTEYVVMGVWDDDVFVIPSTTQIMLSENRTTKKPGDSIWLDRQEAAVVQKRFVLVPKAVL